MLAAFAEDDASKLVHIISFMPHVQQRNCRITCHVHIFVLARVDFILTPEI